ncbi:hypothetical protein ACSNOI_28410, partial [Actinomadura kijaniata]
MTAALDLLAGRGRDLLVRVVAVACSGRTLPSMAEELAGLVVRSAAALDRYGPDFSYAPYVATRRLP